MLRDIFVHNKTIKCHCSLFFTTINIFRYRFNDAWKDDNDVMSVRHHMLPQRWRKTSFSLPPFLCVNIMTKANRRTNEFPLGKSSPEKKKKTTFNKRGALKAFESQFSTYALISLAPLQSFFPHQSSQICWHTREEKVKTNNLAALSIFIISLSILLSLSSAKALAVAQSLRRAFSSVRTSLVITTSSIRWKFLFKCSRQFAVKKHVEP